uniref:Uncharacterized protein n=1 Tax=Arundo donax TaxID=35708 RepID=A0A0A9F013_ARUDO
MRQKQPLVIVTNLRRTKQERILPDAVLMSTVGIHGRRFGHQLHHSLLI